ncbi:hypothetical protein J2X06_002763 [Lysobacter niastensis]|uniref:DUF3667 domain-containing protein n=1 Tax=Lysobacter niastensis TaxID=380629 RepID=A0ABU1WD45_9GAMM|nr:DUF3667 domain-containing protein [Lysobacter niastensis]MDR7135554.1 hypothetical protein [Lysobacter niastensis]
MTASDHATPTHCENCHEPLHGQYCYACGQSVINPVRHASHALEEVFESFWHLDGRIFRTLRDLIAPGRVALNYLAGHRARYVAPLRLFVILSVVTFFVAQFAIRTDAGTGPDPIVQFDDNNSTGDEGKRFQQADTIAEVEQIRAETLKELGQARATVPAAVPGARKGIDAAIVAINRKADQRVEVLRKDQDLSAEQVAEARAEAAAMRKDQARVEAGGAPKKPLLETAPTLADVERLRDEKLKPRQERLAKLPADAVTARKVELREIRSTNLTAGCRAAQLQIQHATATEGPRTRKAADDARVYGDNECGDIDFTMFGTEPWDEEANPVTLGSAPQFVNRWLNRQIAHGRENIARAQKDPSLYFRALVGAVPSALFLLVPVFALLLKLAYLGSGRLYLEHLVVALYSHAYLCLVMLAFFLLLVIDHAIAPHWAGFSWISGLIGTLLWLWLPVYLLLMQKRVYGNGWPVTLLRYLVIGNLYFVLLTFAAVFLAIASIVRM